jgi:hypothetical protein
MLNVDPDYKSFLESLSAPAVKPVLEPTGECVTTRSKLILQPLPRSPLQRPSWITCERRGPTEPRKASQRERELPSNLEMLRSPPSTRPRRVARPKTGTSQWSPEKDEGLSSLRTTSLP